MKWPIDWNNKVCVCVWLCRERERERERSKLDDKRYHICQYKFEETIWHMGIGLEKISQKKNQNKLDQLISMPVTWYYRESRQKR